MALVRRTARTAIVVALVLAIFGGGWLDSDRVAVESDEIAELDRRWKKIEAGAPTIPHERVVGWLRAWGTPGFRPWRAQ